ncbi:hypothetical protein SAY87_010702 [Trapa incisa]|uniref:Uncharacterized protein n=1 Tax=Trapa incisa TaxID=236973 RepID=A0AAN7GJY0_9MYRT|nr:hypothetical protein SAY87_010702 [Trapa incisa]
MISAHSTPPEGPKKNERDCSTSFMGYHLRRQVRHPFGRPGKPDGRCRCHQKHQQSPGVCSLCLAEKLSQLYKGGSSRSPSSKVGAERDDSSCSLSSSLSPYKSSSSDSSTSTSPVNRYRTEKSRLLVKGRSVDLVFSRRGGGGGESGGAMGGFWSRMVSGRGRKTVSVKINPKSDVRRITSTEGL